MSRRGCGCCGCDIREYTFFPDFYSPSEVKCYVRERVRTVTVVGDETPTETDVTTEFIDEKMIVGRWHWDHPQTSETDDDIVTTTKVDTWEDRILGITYDVSDQHKFGKVRGPDIGTLIFNSFPEDDPWIRNAHMKFEAKTYVRKDFPSVARANFDKLRIHGYFDTVLASTVTDAESQIAVAPNTENAPPTTSELQFFDTVDWLPDSEQDRLTVYLDVSQSDISGFRFEEVRLSISEDQIPQADGIPQALRHSNHNEPIDWRKSWTRFRDEEDALTYRYGKTVPFRNSRHLINLFGNRRLNFPSFSGDNGRKQGTGFIIEPADCMMKFTNDSGELLRVSLTYIGTFPNDDEPSYKIPESVPVRTPGPTDGHDLAKQISLAFFYDISKTPFYLNRYIDDSHSPYSQFAHFRLEIAGMGINESLTVVASRRVGHEPYDIARFDSQAVVMPQILLHIYDDKLCVEPICGRWRSVLFGRDELNVQHLNRDLYNSIRPINSRDFSPGTDNDIWNERYSVAVFPPGHNSPGFYDSRTVLVYKEDTNDGVEWMEHHGFTANIDTEMLVDKANVDLQFEGYSVLAPAYKCLSTEPLESTESDRTPFDPSLANTKRPGTCPNPITGSELNDSEVRPRLYAEIEFGEYGTFKVPMVSLNPDSEITLPIDQDEKEVESLAGRYVYGGPEFKNSSGVTNAFDPEKIISGYMQITGKIKRHIVKYGPDYGLRFSEISEDFAFGDLVIDGINNSLDLRYPIACSPMFQIVEKDERLYASCTLKVQYIRLTNLESFFGNSISVFSGFGVGSGSSLSPYPFPVDTVFDEFTDPCDRDPFEQTQSTIREYDLSEYNNPQISRYSFQMFNGPSPLSEIAQADIKWKIELTPEGTTLPSVPDLEFIGENADNFDDLIDTNLEGVKRIVDVEIISLPDVLHDRDGVDCDMAPGFLGFFSEGSPAQRQSILVDGAPKLRYITTDSLFADLKVRIKKVSDEP